MDTASRGRSGYTLIELLLVMVALGLLSTVVYMTWEAIVPRTKLNTAVRELAATLQETRSDAVSRGVPFNVEYSFEESREHPRGYRVVTPFRAGGAGGLAASWDDRLALPWKRLPENIEFRSITIDGQIHTKGVVVVRFDPRGSASDHNIVLVQMPYENTYTVEVQALTGFIHMQAGEFVRQLPKDADFH